MEEMLRHLTRATQKTSTHKYLAENFGEDTVDEARDLGYIIPTLGGRFYYITLKGRRELEAGE